MGWKRKLGIGCGGVIALIGAGAGYLLIAKPWVPPVAFAAPGAGGVRIASGDLLGNYYRGKGEGPRPAILFLGGSEGGLTEGSSKRAAALAEQGYSVFYQSYYRSPGQPRALESIPLEGFDKAIAWLQAQSENDPARIAIMGGSKGAEAALIVAARNPAVRAVVAGMPSNVAWAGIDWEGMMFGAKVDSSWSLGGKPVPHIPYVGGFEREMVKMYANSLKTLPKVPGAAIPVERIAGPVLLICGEQDALWPSCDMARAVEARVKAKGGPAVTLLAYKDAGHAVFGVPIDTKDPRFDSLDSMGGTDAGNNAARSDGWPKVEAFLKAQLKPEG